MEPFGRYFGQAHSRSRLGRSGLDNADVTRNFALVVHNTLRGYDAGFSAQPQMVEGHLVTSRRQGMAIETAGRAQIP
jgi:hypothetical protein